MHIVEAAFISNLRRLRRAGQRDCEAFPQGAATSSAPHTGRTSIVAARAMGWVLARATASSMPPQRTSS